MKRLTEWRGEHAAIVNHRENYIDRLAAYEDTGLEPEEIVQQSEKLKLIDFNQRIKSDRLAEIAKAEYEGRLLVLPNVPEKDRLSILDFLHDCRSEWIHDPSVGLFGPNDNETALMDAIDAALEGNKTSIS